MLRDLCILAPSNFSTQSGRNDPCEEIVDVSAIHHQGEKGVLVSMLLLQKFHSSNTGVFLLHRIIDLIVDWKRFLIDSIYDCKSVWTLKVCLRDYGMYVARRCGLGGHVAGRALLANSDFKRGFSPPTSGPIPQSDIIESFLSWSIDAYKYSVTCQCWW